MCSSDLWWGFGMGATSAPWGERLARPRTRADYGAWLEAQERARDAALPAHGMPPAPGMPQALGMPFDELLLVGLRRREGVNMAALAGARQLAPEDLGALRARLAPFEGRGLLRIEGPCWRLTDPEGLALSNAVLRELLDWWETAGR